MNKPKKKLISLESHEMVAREAWRPARPSGPNGIACPECGGELADRGGGRSFMSEPPTVFIECHGCDYKGERTLLVGEAPKLPTPPL